MRFRLAAGGANQTGESKSRVMPSKRSSPGVFISLEGIDGSGKSTVAERLVEVLQASGRNAILTREPGGTAVGEKVRSILLGADSGGLTPETEALLFAAARAQLVAEVIKPALRRGTVVVTDRFTDSSLAYQAGGRGLEERTVKAVQNLATGGLHPDLTILLDLPVSLAQERRDSDREGANRLDRESRQFHERVASAYLALAASDPARWRVVDASRAPDEVWQNVSRAIAESGVLDNVPAAASSQFQSVRAR
jgi:dTMP kinase